ncbi:Glycosyltransferase involved in cell wall bisynthesis [Goodfellowiella coeruleoviolacea]|uniref:Glycosyltransferase involved in cell wall bisynthesis n=1 Tax=Goodfellowiella coeruleoviolacea TaxID=334858 RepID=A0AAE3GKT2_9PSEU|nr:Glycosyltransferase involved in cell wall bisynthesis [Goodfellowiella coeruleoviolacea]
MLTEQLLAPVPGGTGRYTRELAAALAATAPEGWTVTGVVSRHGDPSAAVIPGVAGPRVLPLPRSALIAAWERGVPLWPGGDAVHAPTPLAPPVAKRGRSLVVTVHDTVPWTHPDTLTPRGANWHRKVIARARARANAIVVPTAVVAAELDQHAPGPAPVTVIGHGVPAALASPPDPVTATVITERLRLPEHYVLAVGTVEPRKGLDLLVTAMAQAQAPNLPLVVAGPAGWGGLDLAELADQAGLARDRLRVLGRVSDTELAVVLHRATVLAAPSRSEGFGLPVLEAMAAGVPVVHSDAPALVEVAGGTGTLVPTREPIALARALREVVDARGDHGAAGRRLAESITAARRRAAGFTWTRAAEALWRLHVDLHRSARAELR